MGLSGLSVKTLKNHERMELSWANHVYNTEFSVETSLEHGFAIENTYSKSQTNSIFMGNFD